MNVLIIEDEKMIASSIKTILKKIPFVNVIDVAHTFDEGFNKATSKIFDLILVDIFLGENQPDGFELCKIIRKNNQKITLIMITGYRSIKHIEKAFNIGVNDYITKPFNHKEVEIRIKRWLMISHQIKTKTKIKYQSISFNPHSNYFAFKEDQFNLTKKNKSLLLIFLQTPEKVLTTNYLTEKLWGDYLHCDKKRNIRSNIQLLKKSLPKECQRWIQNIRGEGYVLKKGSL